MTKFAAHMAGMPMVAVATNLAHDGIASPVSSLEHESGKGSYGVARRSRWWSTWTGSGRRRRAWSGPGSATWSNNLSAIADWELAAADTGEPVDGLAVTLARTGGAGRAAPAGHDR